MTGQCSTFCFRVRARSFHDHANFCAQKSWIPWPSSRTLRRSDSTTTHPTDTADASSERAQSAASHKYPRAESIDAIVRSPPFSVAKSYFLRTSLGAANFRRPDPIHARSTALHTLIRSKSPAYQQIKHLPKILPATATGSLPPAAEVLLIFLQLPDIILCRLFLYGRPHL